MNSLRNTHDDSPSFRIVELEVRDEVHRYSPKLLVPVDLRGRNYDTNTSGM